MSKATRFNHDMKKARRNQAAADAAWREADEGQISGIDAAQYVMERAPEIELQMSRAEVAPFLAETALSGTVVLAESDGVK